MKSAMISSLNKLNSVTSVLLVLLSVCMAGCESTSNSVIASTGTTIGVELSQNPTSQSLTGVLGYKRGELAYVPTNKCSKRANADGKPVSDESACTSGGAKESANVLMELNYKGIFSSGGGIYQRLAVGDIAVGQPGAALMFAKDVNGDVDTSAYKAVAAATINDEKSKIKKISAYISNADGGIDTEKWQGLIDSSAKSKPKVINETTIKALKKPKTLKELEATLFDPYDSLIAPLYDSLPVDNK